MLSVSHELRTPLTSLISGAELLLDGTGPPLDHETRDTVEILHRNANRLRRLIENLLLVSRLQTGMEELVPTEVDVARCLIDGSRRRRPTTAAREVELSSTSRRARRSSVTASSWPRCSTTWWATR